MAFEFEHYSAWPSGGYHVAFAGVRLGCVVRCVDWSGARRPGWRVWRGLHGGEALHMGLIEAAKALLKEYDRWT